MAPEKTLVPFQMLYQRHIVILSALNFLKVSGMSQNNISWCRDLPTFGQEPGLRRYRYALHCRRLSLSSLPACGAYSLLTARPASLNTFLYSFLNRSIVLGTCFGTPTFISPLFGL